MVRSLLLAVTLLALPVSALAQKPPVAAAAKPERKALEGIAAIVNDKPISYSDVRQRARLLLMSFGGAQPSQQQIQQITGQALEVLIDERLQLEKAAEFKLTISPEEINGAIDEMARPQGGSGDELKKQLKAVGISPAILEDQMRAEIAWSRVMGGLYGQRIRVSDYQINEQINRLRSSLKKTQYRVSEIFLYAPDAETRTQAMEASKTVIQQLKQGADFRVAAQRLSSAPTAATGGDMGWVSAEDLPSDISAAVTGAANPGVLDPIQVDNGVYIINVVNKREPTAAVTKVSLKRLVSSDGSESNLKKAMERIKSCNDVATVANTITNLRSTDLKDISLAELGDEGRDMVAATATGKATEIFAAGQGLAVMYVCSRQDGAEALPSREELKSSLKNRELSMISERELRDLRREATIIYR